MYDMRHAKCVCGIIFLVLFITATLWAVPEKPDLDDFSIETAVDKTQINVGDRIKLELFTKNAKGYEVLFSEDSENFGDFSLVQSRELKKKWYGAGRPGHEYILTAFDAGIHVIPPVEIKYRLLGETVWQIAESEQIPIDVTSLLTKESTDIRDLKDIVGRTNGKIFIILSIIFVLGAIVAAGIIWRGKIKQIKAEEALRKKPAHEIAYVELYKLKKLNLPEKGFIKEYYIRLSDIMRRYLENRFSFRAPEMTTEEFLPALTKSPRVEKEHKDLLKRFLVGCDMVKFAKYGPSQLEMLDSFRAAEDFVDGTKKVEEEEEA